MNINLKEYQERAVDQLTDKVKGLLELDGVGEVCVFQAPTGSGKTVMTAKFIEGLIREMPETDLCFVWVSIGKGNLHLQSKHSLERIFGGSPRVSLIEEEFNGGRERIVRNEVVVANWEKLRTKDRESGDWKNVLMKDGEKINFREVLAKTREQRQIILIIDESHIGATAERTGELRKEINADVIIEMSATPTITQNVFEIVRVNPSEVIEEGMIKKELIINEGINKIENDEKDSQEVVLEMAFQKRLELKKLFEKEGVNVNPLVLIQIPTAEAGKDKIEAVREFLGKRNTIERKNGNGNGKLAIWLADQKSEQLDWISEPDNEIEFLVFKQAIDTGWDCPRAHILVKFRESHSETFEIQTVGRILRMPEQKHYESEDLNRGYIFTNVQSILVKKEEYNPNIIKHLKGERINDYKSMKLTSYFKQRVDYGDITSSFTPTFEKVANEYFGLNGDYTLFAECAALVEKKGISVDVKHYEQEIIADTKLDMKSFDELQGKITPETIKRLTIAGNDLDNMFKQVIKSNLGSFRGVKRSVSPIKTAIYCWFKKYLGSDSWNEPSFLTQKIFLHNGNKAVFERILVQAIEAYREVKEEEVREKVKESEKYYDFELPKELFFNDHTDELVEVKNYAYDKCYLGKDRSEPEKHFEKFLDGNSEKIAWWWKNGENRQDYFGVRYEYKGEIFTFYPDYLVQFKAGNLGILEVKDSGDRDGGGKTKAKAEALQKHLASQKNDKLFGGVVIEKNGDWLINSEDVYNWEKCENGDWGEWKILEL
ncbi:MAG: DEAD/DEAH box helicase family protein [Candidatus Moranbacteria bacterium]|nr:DEAD/DEAH box helicase family protein [Candidatus Moranbacteria bacterium]